jgi:hypothetical protein
MSSLDNTDKKPSLKTQYKYKPTDIYIITSTGEKLAFYKSILMDQSPKLNAMLTHNMQEKQLNEIILNNEYSTVKDLLDVIHPIDPLEITLNTVFIIMPIAYEHEFTKILDRCLEYFNFLIMDKLPVGILTINIKIYGFIINRLTILIEQLSTDTEFCAKLQIIIDKLIEKASESYNGIYNEEDLKEFPGTTAIKLLTKANNNKLKYKKFADQVIEQNKSYTYNYRESIEKLLKQNNIT